MIAGLIDTDEGDIFLNQERINHLPMHVRAKEVLDTYHKNPLFLED